MYTSEPKIEYREQKLYMGLRTIAPFKGMLGARDQLLKELRLWVNNHGVANQGPFFFRLNVIDMRGPMDMEVGFMVPKHLPDDVRVHSGILPAGRYASLVYSRYALRGNKALLEWANDNGIRLDRWDDPAGDAFRCRYETYLTDYRVEPRKTHWQVELAIRLADE